ncbi:arginine repressor [Butyrivibrio sp. AE2032]|uniref:arginine repressor n=1 Tax=Butyrivibrio sp. AE2032 TaxID=1458463 RepID=UPI00054E0404|nr:arginine repressor [Butyrivibrio sp. AE2032]
MKKNRHDKIIEIINNNVVETQEQLVSLLCKEGYDVTQATISRDIRQMKLTKMVLEDGRQKYVYTNADPKVMHDKYVNVLKAGYVSVDTAENLIVIKTVPGMAMALATATDALEVPQIVGCIAGDDTIFVALKTKEDAEELKERFLRLIERQQ